MINSSLYLRHLLDNDDEDSTITNRAVELNTLNISSVGAYNLEIEYVHDDRHSTNDALIVDRCCCIS